MKSFCPQPGDSAAWGDLTPASWGTFRHDPFCCVCGWRRRIEDGQDLELDQEAGSEEEGKDRSASGDGMGAQEPPVTTGFGWRRLWCWHAASSPRGGRNAKG